LRDAVAVRDAGGSVQRGVRAVERNPVLSKSRVLLLNELEVDLGPAPVMHDEEIRLCALRARDRVERGAHRGRDARDDVRSTDDQAVRFLFVELGDLEALVQERNDVVEPNVLGHANRSVRIRFTTVALALRPSFPMTAPTRAPRAIVFPALWAATAPGFAL